MPLSTSTPEPANRGMWERALLAGPLSAHARLIGLVLAIRSTDQGQVQPFTVGSLSAIANLPAPEVHQALAELRKAQRLVLGAEKGYTRAWLTVPGPHRPAPAHMEPAALPLDEGGSHGG